MTTICCKRRLYTSQYMYIDLLCSFLAWIHAKCAINHHSQAIFAILDPHYRQIWHMLNHVSQFPEHNLIQQVICWFFYGIVTFDVSGRVLPNCSNHETDNRIQGFLRFCCSCVARKLKLTMIPSLMFYLCSSVTASILAFSFQLTMLSNSLL